MRRWKLIWSPEGREIDRVEARDVRTAIRKAPMPYRRYLDELYAVELPALERNGNG
jgi:hypothetical protein